MADFLNPQISKEFRETINDSPIFTEDDSYKEHFNLACAVMDRLDTCVRYLNENNEYPKSEKDFLTFLMFSCMLVDAVNNILKDIGLYINNMGNQYFKETCMKYPLNLSEENCPNDDKFFEYFRALTFAHPFETSRPNFLVKGEAISSTSNYIAKSFFNIFDF